jgi:hypothetical protein
LAPFHKLLELFGGWIGNTDMHLGNISLRPVDDRFELLPIYDMLPMALAPLRGEVTQRALRPPIRSFAHEDLWLSAGLASIDFWRLLAGDGEVSDDFRALSEQQAARSEEMLRG